MTTLYVKQGRRYVEADDAAVIVEALRRMQVAGLSTAAESITQAVVRRALLPRIQQLREQRAEEDHTDGQEEA